MQSKASRIWQVESQVQSFHKGHNVSSYVFTGVMSHNRKI